MQALIVDLFQYVPLESAVFPTALRLNHFLILLELGEQPSLKSYLNRVVWLCLTSGSGLSC